MFCADGLAKRFGLTPDQYGENLRDNYQRHEVEQEAATPLDVAKEYISRLVASLKLALKYTTVDKSFVVKLGRSNFELIAMLMPWTLILLKFSRLFVKFVTYITPTL